MSNIQLNFNGFSSRVFIDGEKVSATDASLSASENLITFDGAYGGMMNYSAENYFRLNTTSFYELPEISCSIGTEITFPQINNLFFDWLEDRGKERSVEISAGNDSNETFYFKNCYFKSLKLGASQNSLVTANYDFYVLSRELFNEPIKNNVPKLQNNKNNDFVFDMNSGDKDKIPIGFWETEITGFGEDKKVLDWSLNISQNVIPKYYCGRNSDDVVKEPPLPDIMIGYPKMELNVSFLMDKEEFDKKVFFGFKHNDKKTYPENNLSDSSSDNELTLKIRGKKICKFLYGAVSNYSPSLNFHGGITFGASYLINQIYLNI